MQLDYDSSMLTNFHSCYSRYRFLRLAAIWDSCLIRDLPKEAYTGTRWQAISGIVCIADDVINHGEDREEYDHNLKTFLERCKYKCIKRNRDMLKLRMSEVTFKGHLNTKYGHESDL